MSRLLWVCRKHPLLNRFMNPNPCWPFLAIISKSHIWFHTRHTNFSLHDLTMVTKFCIQFFFAFQRFHEGVGIQVESRQGKPQTGHFWSLWLLYGIQEILYGNQEFLYGIHETFHDIQEGIWTDHKNQKTIEWTPKTSTATSETI